MFANIFQIFLCFFYEQTGLTICLLKRRLLIVFAYSLDPDQARQNVGPDLDPTSLTL